MDSRQPELSRLTLMCSDHEVAEFTWNHDRQAVTGKTHVLDAAHAPLMATDPSGNITRGYVDLGLLLAQVADEFYPILNEQHKEVQVDIREDLTVLVDGDKMARVFNNIMKNAIAYSYEGSTITIEARRRDGGGVRVRFINQGDPIPEAKLKVIFEKFYRLDAARATNRGGAGLGLAIAKEIVCAHGGTVACESTPEHTIFTIELPAA